VSRSHYDLLGVAPTASPTEIRQAYLRRARELHPDRDPAGASDRGRARAMQDVNAAWWVLRDPERRRRYDESRRGSVAPPQPQGRAGSRRTRLVVLDPDDPRLDPDVDLDPRPYAVAPGDFWADLLRFAPWLALAAVLVVIFVFTAYAGSGNRDAPERAVVGSCVRVQAGLDVRTVSCDLPNDGRVVSVAERTSRCPSGTVGHRVRGEGRAICLRR
jgi:hypothetical protein